MRNKTVEKLWDKYSYCDDDDAGARITKEDFERALKEYRATVKPRIEGALMKKLQPWLMQGGYK